MRAFDAIVIGSGFGGAVAACRLAERGRSVLVLERGRRWGRTDFPRPSQQNAPWWFDQQGTGIYERRRFPQMQVIVAAGVGGGSLVYTNVQKVPPPEAFVGWPAFAKASLDSARDKSAGVSSLAEVAADKHAQSWLEYLLPYYQRVRAMLEPAPIPHDLQRIRAFEQAYARSGLPGRVERPDLAIRWPAFAKASAGKPARLDPAALGADADAEIVNKFGAVQQACNLCGTCVFGCDRHAKNTLDLTYLKRAESLGAEVWPLCQVTRIAPAADGHEVTFRRLTADTSPGSEEPRVRGRSLFLAAGSLGTTELLLRARDVDRTLPALSPRLGYQWSANGDFFAGLLNSRQPIIPTVGPSVTAAVDATGLGFYLMEGTLPSSLATGHRSPVTLLVRLLSLLRAPFLRQPQEPVGTGSCGDDEAQRMLAYMGAFFLMGRDASDGRLVLDAKGELQLLWDWRESEPLLGRMRRYLEELGRGYGGSMLIPQPWWPVTLGTVHPLGGCPMGRDASEGVADPFGRVFGYDNLYICDGSLIPRALGVPPSMTIAALAEHVAEKAMVASG